MLDRLPSWLRHALIAVWTGALTALLPVAVDHQEDVRDLIVRDLHLPAASAVIVATLITAGILRWTTATRKYGVGSPPAPDNAAADGGMSALELLLAVFLVFGIACLVVWLHMHHVIF